MHFYNPYFLMLLVLIPLLWFWYFKFGKYREGTVSISNISFTSLKIRKSGEMKNKILIGADLIILTLIVFALARPQKIKNLNQTDMEVIDILLVIDISSSMLANDFKPNRLEAVKKTAFNFIEGRIDDRIGIIVFAAESFIQCPLTIDKTVLKSLISEISIISEEYDGTAIGMAIANGINRFRKSDVKSKVMILLSDGSNNSGEIDPITAAEIAKDFKIKIYTIGAATNQSVTRIPGKGLISNEIDENTLKSIAGATGGKYFRATDTKTLDNIYDEISQLEKSEIIVNDFTLYEELYGSFLISASLIALIMNFLVKPLLKRPY